MKNLATDATEKFILFSPATCGQGFCLYFPCRLPSGRAKSITAGFIWPRRHKGLNHESVRLRLSQALLRPNLATSSLFRHKRRDHYISICVYTYRVFKECQF